jgi:hypothetical protein
VHRPGFVQLTEELVWELFTQVGPVGALLWWGVQRGEARCCCAHAAHKLAPTLHSMSWRGACFKMIGM